MLSAWALWEGQVPHLTDGVTVFSRIAWKASSFYLGLEMELRTKTPSAFQRITQIPKPTLTSDLKAGLGLKLKL